MKFHAQTTLVALAILCATLLLSSFLSIAAFEKIYAAALISTYEMAAKSLQQKIETGLKFGKPLGRFTGMDRLLAEMLELSPEITSAGVADRDGWVLYHTDPGRLGQRLPASPAVQAPFTAGATRRSGEVYVTTMPLRRQAHDPLGVLQVTFSRAPLHDRLKTMAIQTLGDLVPLLAAAALLLAALLLFGLTRPLNRRLLRLSRWLETLGRKDWEAPPGYPAARWADAAANGRLRRYEPDQLAFGLANFARHAGRTLEKTAALQTEIEALEVRLAALEAQVRLSPGAGAAMPAGEGAPGASFLGAGRKAP
jgi:HAMP domain-containing protein